MTILYSYTRDDGHSFEGTEWDGNGESPWGLRQTEDEPQPTAAQTEEFVAWMEAKIGLRVHINCSCEEAFETAGQAA